MMEMSLQSGQQLIARLHQASAYPHATQSIHCIETHCAWVILTGEFAYKIKKPVNFGFLDFSTLEKRRQYCQLEVELNGRFSSDIYLSVEKITGTVEQAIVGEHGGEVLEYAVKMRQFPENCLLSEIAELGQLNAFYIDQLSESIAQFHQTTQIADVQSPYASIAVVSHWTLENFEHIQFGAIDRSERIQLKAIESWISQQLDYLAPIFLQRKMQGYIRNCHGDLHLKNLTLIDNKVRLFDCIEFNDELRWIDVMSEIAFLIMDLQVRGFESMANRFLNQYLHVTGDYSGLKLLSFYCAYRALVRAKVALLRCEQVKKKSEDFHAAKKDYGQYIDYIEKGINKEKPFIMITVGFSGSGKSTLVSQLNEQFATIQIRSDIERKRMQGLKVRQKSDSQINEGLYSKYQTEMTYQHLNVLAEKVIDAGYSVVLDATFLQKKYREAVCQLAERKGIACVILHCVAPTETLRERILQREKKGADPSEANQTVLDFQLKHWQPLSTDEACMAINVDTSDVNYLSYAINKINQWIKIH